MPLNAFIEDEKFWQKDTTGRRWLTQWDIDEVKCKILYDVIKGLDHMHDNRVMHRDIKASNILLDWPKQ
eukprot:SAG31_NODE_43025_length_269_cov_0.594118_1_plen_68_part_01